MKDCYNNSKVLEQRKQIIFNLKFHAGTAAIFSQINKAIIFTLSWCFLCNIKLRYSFQEMLSQDIPMSSDLMDFGKRS